MKSGLQKILILRFSSIGDIVLTTPVIRCLKKQLPGVEIHYATKQSFKNLLENNPYVDKVHGFNGELTPLINELKEEKFDFIVDLHHNLKTLIIKKKLGVRSASFNKLNIEKFFYVNLKINRMPNKHIVDRYLETVKELGIVNDNEGLDYFIPSKDIVEQEWLPDTHKNGFIAVVIGGQHFTKKLPNQRLIELCDRINRPIILLGGKEDLENAEEIASFFSPTSARNETQIMDTLNKRTVIFNAVGKFNLNQSASLLQQSSHVFTHDTGLMHIAAAFKKEVFSIWGNTTPELGMYPYQTKFTIFENKGLSCRPCSKIGFNKCPKGHFKCMNELKMDFYIPE